MTRYMMIAGALFFLTACSENVSRNQWQQVQTVVLLDSPLKSWKESPRERIMIWMRSVTDSTGKDFIPVSDRIAVFDNDGTLWPEQPVPNQLAYAIDLLKTKSFQHPEWMKDAALKAFIESDIEGIRKGGKKGLAKLLAVTHSGITQDEFNKDVKQWIDTAKHSKFQVRYKDLIYQPMLELLQYLREHDFKTFIVSGGGADFMRVWTEEVYGIPPYQVVGSYSGARFEMRDSTAVITKLPEDLYVNDKEGKPVAINRFIGKIPVFCGGNSDGDLAMMQYTASSKYRSMNVLLHHTDGVREFAYDLNTLSGHLEKALVEARSRGWVVVDMKNDLWRVFPFEK